MLVILLHAGLSHVVFPPVFGCLREGDVGQETADAVLEHVQSDGCADRFGLGSVGSRSASIVCDRVGLVPSEELEDGGNELYELTPGTDQDHPDEDVDLVGNAENGERLGHDGDAQGAEPEVLTELASIHPVVGAQDVSVIVVGRGGSIAEDAEGFGCQVDETHDQVDSAG